MSEAFGGCCVYVEGARHDVGRHGVLNFLIAGSDALAFANLTDEQLIQNALKSLPASIGKARDHFVEGKIHRWLSSVNALPGRNSWGISRFSMNLPIARSPVVPFGMSWVTRYTHTRLAFW